MAKTLTGYIAGATGASWLISTACKAQFDLMAAAAIKPVNEGGCGATLTLVDGYVSRYEAIRQLVAIKGFDPDPTLGDNVKDLTKNGAITDEQWLQLESNFNQDGLNYVNIFQTNKHAYLGDGLLLAVGGTDNAGASYGCKPSQDLRRTGDVVKIAANGKGAMNADNEADWMLVSGSQFGFYFIGPDVQTFTFNPSFKFGPDTLESKIKYLGSRMFFLVKAADKEQIPTQLFSFSGVLTTNWNNDEFKQIAYRNPKEGLAYYTNWAAALQAKSNYSSAREFNTGVAGSGKAKAQLCAIEWNQPWLFGMERIY